MRRDMSLAGVGAVAFAVALVVGFTLLGPKGGRYSDTEMASFVAQPAAGFIISIGLLVVSIGGLILLMAYLSEAWFGVGRLRRISWAASVVAAASFLLGWGLYLAPTSAIASGGPATDPGVTYVFVSAGMIVLFGVGGIALGTALVMLAARGLCDDRMDSGVDRPRRAIGPPHLALSRRVAMVAKPMASAAVLPGDPVGHGRRGLAHRLVTRHGFSALGSDSSAESSIADQAFRRGHPIRLLDEVGDEVPVLLGIERDADPAVDTHVGRHEEPIRVAVHQRPLRTGRRLAPDPPMPCVRVVTHREDLVSHSPGRVPDAATLGGLGEGQADGADSIEKLVASGIQPTIGCHVRRIRVLA